MPRPTYLIALLAAGAVAASCSFDDATVENQQASEGSTAAAPATTELAAKPPKEPVLVRVRPLARGPIEHRLEATANVESLDVVDVVSERAEPVARVQVEEGDQVAAGQALAELRADQVQLVLMEVAVRLNETRSQMQQAERDYQRNLRLWEEGGDSGRLIAEQTVETSRQVRDVAKTAHETAQVAHDRAKWDEARCTLRSPIAGTVTARDISVGDMAVIGQRAFQITDLSRPKVVFYRPQRELALLREQQRLVATSEALPGVQIRGLIERVSPIVDAATGTVKVVAALEPDGRVLPAGILMRLVVILERREGATLVPKEALLHEGGGAHVFVVREGVARRVEIEPGFEDAQHLEALGPALQEGDLLIVVGADRLADGDPVEVTGE
jgi:membrane fusion protein (multidrug efflux system)